MHAEAIFFFDEGRICKEMRFAEFDAVLDGMVPMMSFADRRLGTAYVQLDEQLIVVAVVFFIVEFDARGMVSAKWNLPLRDLADRGKPGPKLGDMYPKMVCRTQGPMRYTEQLWEPFRRTVHDPYWEISRMLKRNKLGFSAHKLSQVESLASLEPSDNDVPTLTSTAVTDPSSTGSQRLAELERQLQSAREKVGHYQQRDEQWQRKVRALQHDLETARHELSKATTLNQRLTQYVRQLKVAVAKRVQRPVEPLK